MSRTLQVIVFGVIGCAEGAALLVLAHHANNPAASVHLPAIQIQSSGGDARRSDAKE